MPELTEQDALQIAWDYYKRKFPPKDVSHIIATLVNVDIVGLITYAFNAGVRDAEGGK